jgi:hypothetical protein
MHRSLAAQITELKTILDQGAALEEQIKQMRERFATLHPATDQIQIAALDQTIRQTREKIQQLNLAEVQQQYDKLNNTLSHEAKEEPGDLDALLSQLQAEEKLKVQVMRLKTLPIDTAKQMKADPKQRDLNSYYQSLLQEMHIRPPEVKPVVIPTEQKPQEQVQAAKPDERALVKAQIRQLKSDVDDLHNIFSQYKDRKREKNAREVRNQCKEYIKALEGYERDLNRPFLTSKSVAENLPILINIIKADLQTSQKKIEGHRKEGTFSKFLNIGLQKVDEMQKKFEDSQPKIEKRKSLSEAMAGPPPKMRK